MIQYILISIGIYIILIAVIILLIYLLFRKRVRKINEHIDSVIEKEEFLNNIKKKTKKELKEFDNAAANAKDFNDIKHTIINKLFD